MLRLALYMLMLAVLAGALSLAGGTVAIAAIAKFLAFGFLAFSVGFIVLGEVRFHTLS